MQLKVAYLTTSLILILAGCTNFSPEFERPALPVDKTIIGETDETINSIELLAWQQFFTDETAKKVIHLALENNRDLRIAAANVAEAQGLHQIQVKELIPSVGIAGGSNVSRNSGSLVGNSSVVDDYNIGLGFLSYEIDFWGRVSNLKEAALASYFASLSAEQTAKLSVISETASAYYNWLAAKENTKLAKQTLNARNKSLNLVKLRQSVGIASVLDVAQAEVAKASVQAQQAQAENQQSSYYAILQLLVGASISDAIKDNQQITQHALTLTVPETLSSEVLLNRPDIIASEEALYAANANIGAARAAFFPTITLASSAGFASGDLSDLFSSDSKTWSFLPAISIPLFGNSLEARLDVSIARKNKAVAEYEKAIQTAFSEVYTHFQGRESLEKEIIAQKRLVRAQRKRLNLATSRYDAGLTSYIEVLDGQQDLFSAEQALLVAQRNALTTTIQLYKALGGGDEANEHFRQSYNKN